MKLVTHLGYLSYKLTTSSVILVSFLDLTSKINILLLDILSQLYNQLHSLIRYHFKSIHSTPWLNHPFVSYVGNIGQYQYFLFCISFHIYIINYTALSDTTLNLSIQLHGSIIHLFHMYEILANTNIFCFVSYLS